LPRHSLKSRKLIRSLLGSGRRFSAGHIELFFDSNLTEENEDYSVAFLISAGAGKATERNRIKRWMREDFRKLQSEKKIEGGFAVRFRGTAAEVDHQTLAGELERLYNSIRPDE
jgi:ribonuclease P protein component